MPNPLQVANMFMTPVPARGDRMREQLGEVQALESMRALGTQRVLGDALRANPTDYGAAADTYLAAGGDPQMALALRDKAKQNQLREIEQAGRVYEFMGKIPDQIASVTTQDQYDRLIPILAQYGKTLGVDVALPAFGTPEFEAERKAALEAKRQWREIGNADGVSVMENARTGERKSVQTGPKPRAPNATESRIAKLDAMLSNGAITEDEYRQAMLFGQSRPPEPKPPRNLDPALVKALSTLQPEVDEFSGEVIMMNGEPVMKAKLDPARLASFIQFAQEHREQYPEQAQALGAFLAQEHSQSKANGEEPDYEYVPGKGLRKRGAPDTPLGQAPPVPAPQPQSWDSPIDKSRPILNNKDGSFSTERTITIEADGRWVNIPTIIDGRQVSEREAIEAWRAGDNPAVSEASTLEEAERIARERSAQIGQLRGAEAGRATGSRQSAEDQAARALQYAERLTAGKNFAQVDKDEAQAALGALEALAPIMTDEQKASAKKMANILRLAAKGGADHGSITEDPARFLTGLLR